MQVEAGRRLRVTRWLARAPRLALISACLGLMAAGVRSTVTPAPAHQAPRAVAPANDPAADALAEAFVRTYLTWDGSATADRLAAFGSAAIAPEVKAGVRQRVDWTAVTSSERHGTERVVTVAALTSRGAYHVAVTMTRGASGALAISEIPAIVGAPAVDRTPRETVEPGVDDRALVIVLRRALTNYLAVDRTNLLADLDAGADVALPDQVLRLADVDAVTWVARPRRAAVEVRASTVAGVQLTLRYELDVVRRGGRWLVRSIHTDPTGR